MSERSSFVTEYVYCDKCFDVLKEGLIDDRKYLNSQQIKDLPIIAGKFGGGGPSSDVWGLVSMIDDFKDRLCHKVTIGIIPDSGEVDSIVIDPKENTVELGSDGAKRYEK